jgi:hypothetical protein
VSRRAASRRAAPRTAPRAVDALQRSIQREVARSDRRVSGRQFQGGYAGRRRRLPGLDAGPTQGKAGPRMASAQCSSYITGEILPIIGGYSGG